jgi:uncharacterized protein YggE
MTRPLRLLALALALAPLGLAAAQERVIPPPTPQCPPCPPQPRTIRVGGEGRASAAPDVAIVTIGVEAIGKTLARTRADADVRMREVVAAAKASGIDPKDVQTTRYDVQIERPWKDGEPGPITGYHVSNHARVKVRDLTRLGALLDKAAAAGSNAIQGLAFEKDDTTAEEARALAQAVKAARAKADALAKAAGVALGEVVSIGESVSLPPPIPMRMEMAMAKRGDGAPVESGEIEVVANVEIVFGIR